jgi:crotonobetainyl-CoA:carnitine CoA-transferase CaiB-like acyl-CoA transferase
VSSKGAKSKPPLTGVRVLDLSRALAGPFCTMMLADLGADVVKVEPPGRGDETRDWGPPFVNGESAYFMSVNRNKRSIVIDLKSKYGVAVLKKLAKSADVLVENFRPGTMEKLGVGYDTMRRLNQKMVYCSISGFGQTGPYRDRAGYDLVIFAESGQMSITGEQGRPPVKAGVAVSDIGAGMYGAFAIASALLGRSRTGRGEFIDVSLFEGQISWLTYQAGNYFATEKDPVRLGSAHPTIAPYQAFKARDDYFVIAVGNDDLWRKFCTAIGEEGLLDDPRFTRNPDRVKNRVELEKVLSDVFDEDDASHWVAKLREAGVPCGAINSLSQVFSDPQALAREVVLEVTHEKAGKIKQLNMPFKLGGYRFRVGRPPPTLGENTTEILKEAGYTRDQIRRLLDSKAVS